MPNDNKQPLLIAGKLPKQEYKSLQEFVNDLPKVLLFPIDAVSIIKGANGERGVKGERGLQGPAGPAGNGASKTGSKISIPEAATYLEFNIFPNWRNATFTVINEAFINPIDGEDEMDTLVGWVGVGTIVQVSAIPSPTKLRCYFIFGGGATSVPGPDFYLQHTSIS